MSITVSLSEFIGTIQSTPHEYDIYLHKQTGELVMLSDEEYRAVQRADDPQSYPEWQQEMLISAKEVLEDEDEENYLLLPEQDEINEYQMMKAFCDRLPDEQSRHKLLRQLRGSGAFRRFKNTIRRHNVEQDWYRFRDEAYKKIAIDWLDYSGIAYEDDVK